MPDSILNSVKAIIGIVNECTDFDTHLILITNTVLATVRQIGVGVEGFTISGASETWDEFLAGEEQDTQWVRSYVPLKVWLIFDANGITSGTTTAIKEQVAELEWRFFVEKDNWLYDQEESSA